MHRVIQQDRCFESNSAEGAQARTASLRSRGTRLKLYTSSTLVDVPRRLVRLVFREAPLYVRVHTTEARSLCICFLFRAFSSSSSCFEVAHLVGSWLPRGTPEGEQLHDWSGKTPAVKQELNHQHQRELSTSQPYPDSASTMCVRRFLQLSGPGSYPFTLARTTSAGASTTRSSIVRGLHMLLVSSVLQRKRSANR